MSANMSVLLSSRADLLFVRPRIGDTPLTAALLKTGLHVHETIKPYPTETNARDVGRT